MPESLKELLSSNPISIMSRFVTAGGEEAKPSTDPAREDAWAKAQAAIEASRAKPKSLQDGKHDGGKSLYEVLQANKGLSSSLILKCCFVL